VLVSSAFQTKEFVASLIVGKSDSPFSCARIGCQAIRGEKFVKLQQKKISGRADVAALGAHFKGHNNKAKLKAKADSLKHTLHYKTEKALSFDIYL
jgi:hypothetical protein